MATSPFLGEIMMFGGNFAPMGYALCQGQILPISAYAALFSLLGTTYGGNGTTNFGLPNMQGLAPMAPGQGAGLSLRSLGDTGGAVTVTLTASTTPQHTHAVSAGTAGGGHAGANVLTPVATAFGSLPAGTNLYSTAADGSPMSPTATKAAGGNLPHNNMQPYQALTFVIALQGQFPPRS
jgi:microcystin-dependent protein